MTYIISSEVSHLGGNNLDWRGLIERLSAFISTVCENEEKKPNPTRNKSSTHDTHKEKYYLRWFSGFMLHQNMGLLLRVLEFEILMNGIFFIEDSTSGPAVR